MHSSVRHWARRCGLALVLAYAAATGPTAVGAVAATSFRADRVPVRADADVTERDVAASNEKIRAAYGALIDMWTAHFRQLGTRFVPPSIARYRGVVRTSCGVMPGNNALYCPGRNTIFFDEVFIARQTKNAARDLGTDGDMVAVGIIAHEMGHAVAIQLGEDSEIPYENEATADCLAGVFARQAQHDGSLEKGDLEEAFYGMAAAGDPTPRATGNARYDARVVRLARLLGHGTRGQRMSNFKAGLDGGAPSCLESFR